MLSPYSSHHGCVISGLLELGLLVRILVTAEGKVGRNQAAAESSAAAESVVT